MRKSLLALLIAVSCVPDMARAAWYEAKSRHFTVYAQDRPEKLRAYIQGLERYDSAVRLLFAMPDQTVSSSSRVTIFVLPDQNAVEQLYSKRANNIAGFYEARAGGSVAFASAGNDGPADETALTAQAVLFHEYAHHLMFTAWPDAPFPTWLVEGFAEFNAPARLEKNGDVTIGIPPVYRRDGVFNELMPVKRLVATSQKGLNDDEVQALYGRGWLLTHYLAVDRGRMAQLNAYLRALQAGKPSLEAARAAFGDPDKLDFKLDNYSRTQLPGYVLPASALKVGDIEVRPLSAGESAVMPARIRSTRGVDEATAGDVVALARRLAAPYPNDPGAQNELAEAEYDARHWEEADAAAARAVAADPLSAHALIYRGRAAVAMAARDKVVSTARWTEARSWFLAANKLDTENAEPLQLFYDSFFAQKVAPTANAQAALLYAQVLAPFDSSLRINTVNILLNQGKTDEARAMLLPLAYNPHGGSLAQLASKMIDDLDKNGAKSALADMSAKPAEADAKKD